MKKDSAYSGPYYESIAPALFKNDWQCMWQTTLGEGGTEQVLELWMRGAGSGIRQLIVQHWKDTGSYMIWTEMSASSRLIADDVKELERLSA